MLKVRYEPVLQLGHIMQAGAIVVTIGGSVLGAYLSINAAIGRQDTRIALIEQGQATAKTDDAAWRSEMRQSMLTFNGNVTELSRTFSNTVTQLSKEIADLRVSLAKVEPKK